MQSIFLYFFYVLEIWKSEKYWNCWKSENLRKNLEHFENLKISEMFEQNFMNIFEHFWKQFQKFIFNIFENIDFVSHFFFFCNTNILNRNSKEISHLESSPSWYFCDGQTDIFSFNLRTQYLVIVFLTFS